MMSSNQQYNEKPTNTNNFNSKMQPGQAQGEISHAYTTTKGIIMEYFLLVLFVFSSSLSFYLTHYDLIVIITGIVLSLAIILLVLLHYIAEQMNYRYSQNILYPGIFFFTGLGFIFQDPDILRVFFNINSQPSFLPSLLSLILLSITVGIKEPTNTNMTFASIILGILSFCLTVNQHEITNRSIYLFLSLLIIIFQTFKRRHLSRKRKISTVYDLISEEKDCDMDFEEITTKLK